MHVVCAGKFTFRIPVPANHCIFLPAKLTTSFTMTMRRIYINQGSARQASTDCLCDMLRGHSLDIAIFCQLIKMVQLITHLRSVVWPFTQMSSWKATSTNYDFFKLFLHVFSLSSNPQRWEWLHPTLESLGSSWLKCGISSGCNFSSCLVLMPARVKPRLRPCLQHFGTQESSTFLSIETMTLATQRRRARVSTACKHVPSAAMLSNYWISWSQVQSKNNSFMRK